MTEQQKDGLTCSPDTQDQMAAGIDYLHKAIEALATGMVRSFSLIEIDGEGLARKSMVTLDGAHLEKLADSLHQQSVLVSRVAARWQGNAPPASRSNRTQ